jgi:hypothetical protein
VLAAACILIAFHPICMAAHYRLWSKEGRYFYIKQKKDFPYSTTQEKVCTIISIIVAVIGAWYVGR